ncbi:MAG TPA: NAD(P)/FAD-dependent oxidoreductase [Clostridia bacterium]|nr:NAD(P)/FAD-dependent oxidoreductase [Clostridia bacterium]
MIYDAAIIGAGVVGALTARELSRYDIRICVLEAASDAATGSSKANSGIVHAGYDAMPGTLKALLNVRGNGLFGEVTKELGVPFKRIGSLVLAFSEEGMETVRKLYSRGLDNGVPDMKILNSGDEVLKMEPNISAKVVGALHAPSAGITNPYELTYAGLENAVANGTELITGARVIGISYDGYGGHDVNSGHDECGDCGVYHGNHGYIGAGGYDGAGGVFTINTARGPIWSRFVINAAGIYSDKLSEMIGDDHFSIRPRKGEYLLLDKEQGHQVHSVIFQTPAALGKGILVTPTADGNLLIGPSAGDIEDREDLSTTASGMENVTDGALKSVPGINLRQVVTSFAGLRTVPSTGDFIIGPSMKNRRFINAAGIDSPGLTSAPAIALYIRDILKVEGLELVPKKFFDPVRKPIARFSDATDEEREALIRDNHLYGNVVCRCELVTEAEIVEAIRRPAGAKSVDAVKRRTRSGMGRCQGGFCTPRIAEIISRECGIPMQEVRKNEGGSILLTGKTKGVQ